MRLIVFGGNTWKIADPAQDTVTTVESVGQRLKTASQEIVSSSPTTAKNCDDVVKGDTRTAVTAGTLPHSVVGAEYIHRDTAPDDVTTRTRASTK